MLIASCFSSENSGPTGHPCVEHPRVMDVLGCPRGSYSTKIHLTTDGNGFPPQSYPDGRTDP